MTTLKGIGPAPTLNGTPLRIAIIHARWNPTLIAPLLSGTLSTLQAAGVLPQNIVVQSVPGSWELPAACRGVYTASQIQATRTSASVGVAAGDLLGGSTSDLDGVVASSSLDDKDGEGNGKAEKEGTQQPFDAVIAIGVLIKGETMHFEYIAESVSHGLMRVQLDSGVPLVFGLLTVLTEEQAMWRAGVAGVGGDEGHNHGEDWGRAAVEMGVRRREWAEGRIL